MTVHEVQHALSGAGTVLVVAVAAVVLLTADLTHREVGGTRVRYRVSGLALTVVFLALVVLRFTDLGR